MLFRSRVEATALNKRTVESLVKAGAFDSLGHPRQGLGLVADQVIEQAITRRKERDAGIMSLFGDSVAEGDGAAEFNRTPIPDTEYAKTQRLAFEKEMLGLYVSDHPLMGAGGALRRHTDSTIGELREAREGDMRTVGGVVTALNRKYTKRGDLMATLVLEDLASAVEVFVFPKTMAQYGPLLEDDAIVCIKGRLDLREDQPKVVAMEIVRPELVLDGGPPVRIRIKPHQLDDTKAKRLADVLREHPGESPVYLHLDQAERTTVFRFGGDYLVDARNGLFAELRVLLGADCIL